MMKCAFANVNVVYIIYSSTLPSIYSVFFFSFKILLLNFFEGIFVYLFKYLSLLDKVIMHSHNIEWE